MRYLLDTDHISILQKQSGPEYTALMARIAQVRRADLAFCIVSFHEQVLGCNSYIAQAKLRPISFAVIRCSTESYPRLPPRWCCLSTLMLLPFSTVCAQRVRVATMDLRIASISLSQGAKDTQRGAMSDRTSRRIGA